MTKMILKDVDLDIDVSENSGTPKSSILIGVSIINHPFWGTTIFGNTHIEINMIQSPTHFMKSWASLAPHFMENDKIHHC